MKLMRIGPAGAERPILMEGDRHLDLTSIITDIDSTFWADECPSRIREAVKNRSLPDVDITGHRVGPPVARPGAVICIGLNYAAHAAETDAALPEHPIVFFKAPNTVVGPNDDLVMPPGSTKTDWEVELGVVIGRQARYLSSPDDALAHVGGYCVSNDVSERYLQMEVSGGQWSKGKSCETFNPLGPVLVTADEVPQPQQLALATTVNGEHRQRSSTSDMHFSVATLIWQLSQFMVLEPGDLINTGTPQGVAASGAFPFLQSGDVVEMEIEGLGTQRQTVRDAVFG